MFKIILIFTAALYLSGCSKMYQAYFPRNVSNSDIDVYILQGDDISTLRNKAENNYSGYYLKVTVKPNEAPGKYDDNITRNYVLLGMVRSDNVKCYAIFKNESKYIYFPYLVDNGFVRIYFDSSKAFISNSQDGGNHSEQLLVEIHP